MMVGARRKLVIAALFLMIFIIAVAIYVYLANQKQRSVVFNSQLTVSKTSENQTMELKSSSFDHNSDIPSKYTCDGRDISPPLSISGVPEKAESLALIVDDPDAPMGTWDHWILWNISPRTRRFEEGNAPEGAIRGMNSFKKLSYGGPCPPSGKHRYFFKLYALDTKLQLKEGANKEELQRAMEGHVLDQAVLIGLYRRADR
jgi:hypothetical protein